MLIKGPFAFLIKHIKKFHFILSLLLMYILYNYNRILSVFNKNIGNKTLGYLISSDYINIYIYLAIIASIFILFIYFILFKSKSRGYLIYLISLVLYTLLIILTLYIESNLLKMETKILDIQSVKFLRDVIFITIIVQGLLTIFYLFRGIGFNAKKLEFDLGDTYISADDDDFDYVEISNFKVFNKFKRYIRKRNRLFKYFILENMFIFTFIIFIIFMTASFYLFNYYRNRDIIYKENENFRTKNFIVTVNDTYITKTDYKNKTIAKDGFTYLIVNIDVKNATSKDLTLTVENFKIEMDGYYYGKDTKNDNSMFDLGELYQNQTIPKQETKNYIIKYIIPEKISKLVYLKYISDITNTKNPYELKYITTELSPDYLNNYKSTTYKLNEEIDFSESVIKDTKINISNYDLNKEYKEPYEYCIKTTCNTLYEYIRPNIENRDRNVIMKINTKLINTTKINLDKATNSFDFLNSFVSIKYTYDNKEYVYNKELVNHTPDTLKNDYYYIEVPKEVMDSTNISLIFNVRDKEYIYTLK